MAESEVDFWERRFREQKRTATVNTTAQSRDPQAVARARRVATYANLPSAVAEVQPEVVDRQVLSQINQETIAQYPWMASFLGDPDAAALVPKGGLAGPGNIVDTLGKKPKSAPRHPDLIDPRLAQSSFFGRRQDTPPAQITGIFDTPSEDIGQRATRGYEGPRVRPTTAGAALTGNMAVDTGLLARQFFSTTVGGLVKATGGAVSYLQDTAGLEADDPRRQRAAEMKEIGDFLQTYYRPLSNNWLGERAIDAGQMVFDIAVGGGLAGKALAGYFGATTGLQTYGELSDRSEKKGEALAGALISGGAEYIFEVGPAKLLTDAFGGNIVKDIAVNYLKREMLGELATTATQYGVDVSLADPTEEFSWRTLGSQLLDTAAVAALGGAIVGNVPRLTMTRAAQQAQEAQNIQRGIIEQEMLASVMADAEKDPLRQNAPDAFARLVQDGADTTPVRNVYVPVEAIEKLLEDATLPEAERAVLTLYQDQIADAAATRGDIVVPVGEFAARFTGTLWQKLGEEVRVRPDGMGAREARERRDEIVAELEALDKEAQEAVPLQEEADQPSGEADRPQGGRSNKEDTSKLQVFRQVKQQMLDAGRTEREAQTTAMLAASRAETLASSRYGQYGSALEAWTAEGFTIAPAAKPKRGRKAKAAPVAAAAQPVAEPEDVIASSVGDGTGQDTEGERTVYQAAYHGSPHIFDKFSLDKIGTGEGAQAYGWGLYFAGRREIAEFYRTNLAVRQNKARATINGEVREFPKPAYAAMEMASALGVEGHAQYPFEMAVRRVVINGDTVEAAEAYTLDQYGHYPKTEIDKAMSAFRSLKLEMEKGGRLYEVDIPEDDEYLLWDKPLSEQPEGVQKVIEELTGSREEWGREWNEVKGEDFYRRMGGARNGFDRSRASKELHEAGIAGIKYLDGGSRDAGDGSYNYVVFDDSRVSIKSYEQGARGKTDWFGDGSTVVTLFAQADFSTMLHEMSHVFLEQEFRLAQAPGASEQLKRDVEGIKKWFAANGHPVGEDGAIPTEAHELFARTGERYFREGKAPSAELRDTFAQLRTWLRQVYQSIKALTAYGPAPINPEIREIMDRIIATSDAIDDNAIAPMSQDELGMTDAEYAAYLDSVKGTRDAAEDALLEKMMRAIRQRETSRIAEQRRNVRAELNNQFNEQPGVRALHLLRTGRWLGEPDRDATPVKLNTGWLIDNYGEEVLDRLPRGFPPLHRGDGVVGDAVAELTGMSSGDALVQALLGLRAQQDALRAAGDPRSLREVYVSKAVDEVMAQRHGDIALNDQQIREEAIAALNSERQGERLGIELRQLKKREGRGGIVTPYQVLKKWAVDKIRQGRVSDVASKSALNRYVRGHNKARTAFEAALVKGDDAEAIRQKQAQMINHALLAEGKRAADELETIIKRMRRYAEREAMASVDQDYMDRIHALLAGFSFRAESQKSIEERRGFQAWAAAQAEAGHEVHVPPRLAIDTRNWSEATVEELLDLNDAMQSLIHLGKLKQTLTLRQQERELREFKDEARARILSLPERPVPATSIGDETMPFRQAMREANSIKDVGSAIRNVFGRWSPRSMAAGLVKMEGLFDILDRTQDGTGPLNSLVVRGATDAANRFSELMEEVMAPLVDLYRNLPGKQRDRLNDHITISELTLRVSIDKADEARIGQPIRISRMQHLGMLLNTGNLSNLSKMVGGEKWGDPESMTDLARVRDILWSYASPEDQAMVQTLWDGVGKLWPHIARVERAMSGVVPERVEALGFDTQHGAVNGGYWPVVWDSARSQMGKQQADDAETAMFGIGTGIATEKGHTITRTGAVAPMEYGLERVLFAHMNKVISRIAYAEWVRDTLKVVDSADITGAIDLRMGQEYRKEIKRWIKDQIPSSAVDPVGAKWWENVINQTRINASIGVLGISFTTGMAQMLGLGFSVGVLGEGSKTDGMKYMGLGLWATLKSFGRGPHGAQDFVFARSGEMSRRAKELSVETADVFRQLRDRDTVYHRAQAMAFWHIGFLDLNMVAIPTWLGGYAKALDNGLTEEEAAAYGDKMVRLSQGGGRPKDLSAIQRGNAGQKIAAMFYTPGSVFFNQQWTAVQQARAGEWSKALMPTFYFVGLTTILDAMMSGDWPDEDEDENGRLDEMASWAGRNMLFGIAFGIPGIRDFANTAERHIRGEYAEYGSTGWNIVIDGVAKGWQAAGKLSKEDAEPMEGRQLKSMIAAGGFVFGLPGNQVGKTAGFAYDASIGAVEPDGPWDWAQGLVYGKLPEKEEAK